jgi:fumarylacetoacetate (FAA) hydrolase
MKLASIKNDTRNGALALVSRDLKHALIVYDLAPNLQAALDDWDYIAPQLDDRYQELNRQPGSRAFAFDPSQCLAPLPRAYQWLDASAYLPHMELLRKARGADMPTDARKDPLMYQGNSDYFVGAHHPIEAASEDWGIDLEAELGVILDDVDAGIKPEKAGESIRLLTLINDISLRSLIPAELAKTFGFVHSKAATAFSPVAVTPDELGPAWDGRRILRPVRVSINDELLGEPDAGSDMQFDFPRLIAHAAKTRPLGAGTVLGSGTISNSGHVAGYACIAELRAAQALKEEEPRAYLKFGDRVRIEMLDSAGLSIFGAIEQTVVQHPAPRRAVDVLNRSDEGETAE